jgi:hypothetical protein
LNLGQDAKRRAELRDQALSQQATETFIRNRPRRVFSHLRAYLWEQSQLSGVRNDVYRALKMESQRGDQFLICLGATFVKKPADAPFELGSGARLSFGLTLRETGSRSCVVACTFRYYLPSDLPPGRSPEFLRFDLNRESHSDPLAEPRCHLHPGLDEVRLPLPVLDPFEVLDRIFFVIEPALLPQ